VQGLHLSGVLFSMPSTTLESSDVTRHSTNRNQVCFYNSNFGELRPCTVKRCLPSYTTVFAESNYFVMYENQWIGPLLQVGIHECRVPSQYWPWSCDGDMSPLEFNAAFTIVGHIILYDFSKYTCMHVTSKWASRSVA